MCVDFSNSRGIGRECSNTKKFYILCSVAQFVGLYSICSSAIDCNARGKKFA